MQEPVQTQGVLSCDHKKCGKPIHSYEKYAKCSCSERKPYILCQGCFQKLIEEKGTKQATCPHRKRGRDNGFEVVMPKDDYVHIFLDNSNFWIELKKLINRNQNLESLEDPRLRLDIDKMTSTVARGRDVASKSLYGSQPTSSRRNSLWGKFEQSGWKCKITKRKRGEKGVVQQLVADVTQLVSEAYVEMGTVVILCGDGDVIPAVMVCLEKNWKCEVVMWKEAVSRTLFKLEKDPRHRQLLQIVHADQFIDEIAYMECKFDLRKLKENPHLKSQTAVLLDIDFDPNKGWVRKMTKRLRWPFECCLFGDDGQHLLMVLVSCQNREEGKGNAKEYFDKFLGILKTRYGDKAQSYVQYHHEKRNPSRRESLLTTKNRFEALADNSSQPSTEPKQPKDNSFNLRDKQSNPVFDSSLSSTICSSGPSSMTSGFQSRNSPLTLSCSASRASLPSSGYEGILHDQDSNTLVVEHGERYQTVVPGRRMVKRHTRYEQEMCKNKGRCYYGLLGKCYFRHTEDEIKFFQNPKKGSRCWYNNCEDRECLYAHAPEDGFCRKCNKWGHLESENCRQREQ